MQAKNRCLCIKLKDMSKPLVSVVIVSYNASKTIIETLDSIKAQTYSPLELIIADDYSTDDTANRCEEWLSENHSRFVNSRLIINEKNVGVSANINIGIRASSGKWIKGLGDDMLLPDAIEKNLAFATKNNSDIVVSRIHPFVDETKGQLNVVPDVNYLFPVSNHNQYIALIRNKLNAPSPTWFFSRKLYDCIGGYDERFCLSDDIPFAYRLLMSGFFFSFLPEVTVLYRVKVDSLSHSSSSLSFEQRRPYFESSSKVYYELQAPALRKNGFYGILIRKNLWNFFYRKKIYSRENSLGRYFYAALCKLL